MTSVEVRRGAAELPLWLFSTLRHTLSCTLVDRATLRRTAPGGPEYTDAGPV